METEIELKFFVSPDFESFIQEKVKIYKVLQHRQRNLKNVYFDTPSHLLRQNDIGLRVRSHDDVRVQTLKTAGRVVAGLHQRPEYNAELSASLPDLSLIPLDAWPDALDVSSIQNALQPLFSTDFQRQQWLLGMSDGSQIELAFDKGTVSTEEGKNTPICEIELELKSGQMEALFSLARELADAGNMRLGNLSKAARGYRLATGYAGDEVQALPFVPVQEDMRVEQAFIKALEHALTHWLTHEQIFVERPDDGALAQICQSVALIRQTLVFYGGLIPRRASAFLRQELQWLEGELAWVERAQGIERLCEDKGYFLRKLNAKKIMCNKLREDAQLLPQRDDMLHLMHSTRYCKLLLDLNRWILTRGWQPFLDEKAKNKLQGNIRDFAIRCLNLSWDEIHSAFSVPLQTDRFFYLDQRARLQRSLVSGNCVAKLFEKEGRDAFRLPWLDILDGIDAIQLLDPIRNMQSDNDFTEEDQKQIEKWLNRKDETLLNAMFQSCQRGLTLRPYWDIE